MGSRLAACLSDVPRAPVNVDLQSCLQHAFDEALTGGMKRCQVLQPARNLVLSGPVCRCEPP